jgi:hypothetical protein
MIDFLCFLAALILLLAAALGVPSNRVALGWLGAAFFVLAFFIHAAQSVSGH